jgi:hypothetical protein
MNATICPSRAEALACAALALLSTQAAAAEPAPPY